MGLLRNKIVFITGATSGIGKSCAHQFAAEGASLILAARRSTRLNQLEHHLKEEYNANILTLQLDVRNREQVFSAIASLPEEWKHIDILLNNAGLAKGFSKTHEGNIDDWEVMIDTNLKGLLYVTRAILPQMVERESGHIINIGSTAGHETYPYGNVYSATKFAVKALTHAMRLDVLDKNVKVSSIDPGMVETEFSLVRFEGDQERADNVYKGVTPLTPDDVAAAVLFCATRPPHVNINNILLTCTQQASSTQIHRKAH